MGLFSNPLGYVGAPPNPQTAQVVNSTVRAATLAEVEAAVLNDVYVSPLTMSGADTAIFASPPPLGSTTPNTVAGTTVTATTPIAVASGGTGAGTHTAYALVAGGTTTTGALQSLAGVGTLGQFLVSNGPSALPTFQTATPQLTVTPVAGASQAMTSNHTYIANDSALTTFTLPATSSVGDILKIVGSALNSGGWKVTYTTSQIIWGPAGSSTVTTGNAASATAAAQVVTMQCVVANTTWVITDNSGTITLT